MRRREFIAAIGGAAAWPLAFGLAVAAIDIAKSQSYPMRSISLIVAFPPGANIDIISLASCARAFSISRPLPVALLAPAHDAA